MAIAPESDAGPSAESLSLSASLFTSQISSWIPANFGQSSKPSTSSTTAPSLDTIFLTEHDRGERLGLGHPLLEVPKHQRRQDTSSSLSSLGRKLGVNEKGKGKQGDQDGMAQLGGPDEEEEEESRATIGKKRKVDKVDLWGGKKKAKTKATSTPADRIEQAETTEATEAATATSTPLTPSATSASIASNMTAPNGLNKNQRKKLRKKQKKLSQAEG